MGNLLLYRIKKADTIQYLPLKIKIEPVYTTTNLLRYT